MAQDWPQSVDNPIPPSVTITALNEALQPFYELLGITPQHVYDDPGILIGSRRVTFVVPAVEKPEQWMGENKRPPSRLANVDPQQRSTGVAELQTVVSVEVLA